VKGSQYVLGYEWQLTDLIHLDLQGYLNYQWQRTRIPSERELRDGRDLPAFVDNGKARMRGLELFLRHDQGTRFFGWLSYSLARSERYDYQEQRWRLYNRDILNYVQLIASRRFRNHMELGVRARYSDGYPTTPIDGARLYDGTYFYYVPDEGAAQSDRMTPYVGIDLRFEKKFVFTNWMLTLYTEAINLAHYLRFVKKDNGDPLFDPPETDFYIWSYNYEHRNAISDIPRHSVGVLAEF